MTEFLTSVSIWIGAVIGLLKVIDFLLSEAQKTAIQDGLERIWIWLDDRKMEKFLEPARRYEVQVGLAVGMQSSVILYTISELPISLGAVDYEKISFTSGSLASIIFFSWNVAPELINWMLHGNSYLKILAKSWVLCAAIYLISVGLALLIEIAHNQPISFILNVLLGAFVSNLAIFGPGSAILVTWLIISSALMAFVRSVQFVVLRVTESKNGPVLGVSGLLIGVGAIVKAIAI